MTRASTVTEPRTRKSAAMRPAAAVPAALVALGCASLWLYFWGRDLHRFTQWIAAYLGLFIGQLAFYVVACYLVTRWSAVLSQTARWATLASIIFFAIAFRAMLVPQRPYLSADVYRYVWDGHVQAAGINPYRYVPDDESLRSLRDSTIFPNISGDDHRWFSPYPPIAQSVFWLISLVRPMSVTAFKAAMSSFDVLTTILLMFVLARSGIDPARAIIFAWHPLLIFEGAHSGHVEAVFIAFLALALLAWLHKKHALTGVALALATLVKFYPILLIPAFILAKRDATRDGSAQGRPADVRPRSVTNKYNLAMLGAFIATIGLAYAPYVSAGRNLFAFLSSYVQQEGFVDTGTRYFALDAMRKVVPIPTNVFLILAAAFFAGVAVWWCLKPKRNAIDLGRIGITVIGVYLILTTPRYAWYYAWMIPFLCFVPRVGWLYLTSASALLYLVWYTPLVYPGIPLWLGAGIYVPTLGWLLWERFRRRVVRASEASGSAERAVTA